jgi:hypothetical protein
VTPQEVVLHTRRGCGLCDDAAVELRDLSHRFGFSLEERDIDTVTELRERYNDVIPVVIADGREIARAPFATELLEP